MCTCSPCADTVSSPCTACTGVQDIGGLTPESNSSLNVAKCFSSFYEVLNEGPLHTASLSASLATQRITSIFETSVGVDAISMPGVPAIEPYQGWPCWLDSLMQIPR